MNRNYQVIPWRRRFILGMFLCLIVVLVGRALDLQVLRNAQYQVQGDKAHITEHDISAHRGMITDRHGEPLAISTPVQSIGVNPKVLFARNGDIPSLASALGQDQADLDSYLQHRRTRDFVYLKRRVTPAVVAKVRELRIPGLEFRDEFRRYYPGGEVAAHVVGYTDHKDNGQEGLELAYDNWLQGSQGRKRVLQDLHGRVLKDVDLIEEPVEGKNLAISIDRRIQYLAYRELKSAVQAHGARSGSVVVLDVASGEVLAMVNQPSFNPNARSRYDFATHRNRAVTDLFEPGSTIKPLTVAAALGSGEFRASSVIDTSPGVFYVGRNRVRDNRDYGSINIRTILKKSSNVGVSKLALALDREYLWNRFVAAGVAGDTGSGFPGEQSGRITDYHHWSDIERATLAFGYGLSLTPLQLARIYSVFADDGRLKPVSFLPGSTLPDGQQVIDPLVAKQVRSMMEAVVEQDGTAPLARVPGYRVAGKTGTVKKSVAGGYAEDRYIAVFAGMAPASHPRLVTVVVIDEPSNGDYYGGLVAAPVFSSVMAGSLRFMNVSPDDLPPAKLASHRSGQFVSLASQESSVLEAEGAL